MQFKIIFLLLLCFAQTAWSQPGITIPFTEKQLVSSANIAFAASKVLFNTPKRFHKIRLTDADHGRVLDISGGNYLQFRALVANKDTSVVIGIYVAGHYGESIKDMDMKANAKRVLYYTDTLAADFIRYNKKRLAIWHTDFGVEYSEKFRLFMNCFSNARVVQIADFNRELHIVYFFTESQRKNIEAIIEKTQNIVTPMRD
jgi:hypothetical protein